MRLGTERLHNTGRKTEQKLPKRKELSFHLGTKIIILLGTKVSKEERKRKEGRVQTGGRVRNGSWALLYPSTCNIMLCFITREIPKHLLFRKKSSCFSEDRFHALQFEHFQGNYFPNMMTCLQIRIMNSDNLLLLLLFMMYPACKL